MHEVIDQLLKRRTVRRYDKRPITTEDYACIKQAIMRAPTAGNMTLYSVIDVRDQAIKDALALLCDNQPMIATAPLVLIFLADFEKWICYFTVSQSPEKCHIPLRKSGLGDFHLAMQDAIIAAQSGVVAADALGLGSCYIGDIIENGEKIQKLLHLPPHAVPACMVIMGYHTAEKSLKLIDRCSEDIVFMENTYSSFSQEELDKAWEKPLAREKKTKRVPSDCATIADVVYKRKYTSDFMTEMNRSVKAFLTRWEEED